jgi:GntR family transcriptional regulator
VHCRVDPHSLVPPSQQLVAAVLDAIAAGELAPGDKLPSVRGLAAAALVNPNTVAKAFRDLEHLGATEGRNGAGVFVTAAGPEVAKAIRLAETLAGFRGAVQQALRAGHEVTVLREALEAASRAMRHGARAESTSGTSGTSGRGSKA